MSPPPKAPAWTPAPPPEPETITEALKRYRVKVKNAKNAASINQRSLKDRGVDPERELEKTGLALQLPLCSEVGALCSRLMSPSPE